MKFKELLQSSFKSEDTEEFLDVYFTRPIGLVFALFWNKLGVHPNAITILSIFLGLGAGWYFHYTDTTSNLCAVALLILANLCDSTDGQMARLANKRTLLGRALDGFSGDVWFVSIYLAIIFRLYHQHIPGLEIHWGIGALILCAIAGLLCHSPQSSLADYYRQIHLYFLKGKNGSELDSSTVQFEQFKRSPKTDLLARVFHYNYAAYCRSQEKRTPAFQHFFSLWSAGKGSKEERTSIRNRFLSGSRPLMPYTNILTFNTRAIVLYIGALTNHIWIFPLFEIIVLTALYIFMHKRHEALCRKLAQEMEVL